jgi:hypothetical protein
MRKRTGCLQSSCPEVMWGLTCRPGAGGAACLGLRMAPCCLRWCYVEAAVVGLGRLGLSMLAGDTVSDMLQRVMVIQ